MSRFCEGESLVKSSIDDPIQPLVRFQKKMPLGVHARVGRDRKSQIGGAKNALMWVLNTTLSANENHGSKSPQELGADAQTGITAIVGQYADEHGISFEDALFQIGDALRVDFPTSED